MSDTANLILVALGVGASLAFLVLRKLRHLRQGRRDWSSGHAEACDSCPIIEIRKAQERLRITIQK
ncbi:hypothetical protein KJZ99_06145 [bacterium]|nr:hypothetical protein [bacterium]